MTKQWNSTVWKDPYDEDYYLEFDEMDAWDVKDEDVQNLMDILDYFDHAVEEGHLSEDYDLLDDWYPDFDEYWDDDHFDYDYWLSELNDYMNELKVVDDASIDIQNMIHYTFTNENILRQAFCRRSF